MQYVYVVLQTKELQATSNQSDQAQYSNSQAIWTYQYEHKSAAALLHMKLSLSVHIQLWKFTAKFGTIFKQKVHYKSNAIRMTILRYRIFRHTLLSYKDTEVSDSDNINVGTKVKSEMKPVFLYRSVL